MANGLATLDGLISTLLYTVAALLGFGVFYVWGSTIDVDEAFHQENGEIHL
jgi:hypothetical protein